MPRGGVRPNTAQVEPAVHMQRIIVYGLAYVRAAVTLFLVQKLQVVNKHFALLQMVGGLCLLQVACAHVNGVDQHEQHIRHKRRQLYLGANL